jgi:hypothetical protein
LLSEKDERASLRTLLLTIHALIKVSSCGLALCGEAACHSIVSLEESALIGHANDRRGRSRASPSSSGCSEAAIGAWSSAGYCRRQTIVQPGGTSMREVERMTKADVAALHRTDDDRCRTTRFMSVWLKITCLFAVVMLSGGCASFAELAKGARVQAPVPADTRSVVIYPTAMKPGAVKNVDGLTGAPQLFARFLRDALQERRPSWSMTLVEARDPVPESSIAVTTELLEIDGGSANLRFWIGLGGAGAAVSTVQVTVRDKTGKELATAKISESSECPVGACIESNQAAVERNLRDLAGEAGQFVLDPAGYVKKMR